VVVVGEKNDIELAELGELGERERRPGGLDQAAVVFAGR
jgi:hypothetical protein